MKSLFVLALTAAIVFGFCGCGGRKNQETTPTTAPTAPPATTAPVTEPVTDPTIVDPTIMDPTMEPNVPDPSVDDNHLVDPTNGSEGIIPEIKGRIEGRN